MTNQNSGRKNPNQKHGSHGSQGAQGRGQAPQARPRTVSSNYQVDMFHHQVGASNQQQSGSQGGGYGRYGSGSGGHSQGQPSGRPSRPSQGAPPRHKPSRPVRPLDSPSSKSPAARKGYTNHTFELKNELYKQFTEKLKVSDKSPKEVINQLISFYNMDKIKI